MTFPCGCPAWHGTSPAVVMSVSLQIHSLHGVSDRASSQLQYVCAAVALQHSIIFESCPQTFPGRIHPFQAVSSDGSLECVAIYRAAESTSKSLRGSKQWKGCGEERSAFGPASARCPAFQNRLLHTSVNLMPLPFDASLSGIRAWLLTFSRSSRQNH